MRVRARYKSMEDLPTEHKCCDRMIQSILPVAGIQEFVIWRIYKSDVILKCFYCQAELRPGTLVASIVDMPGFEDQCIPVDSIDLDEGPYAP